MLVFVFVVTLVLDEPLASDCEFVVTVTSVVEPSLFLPYIPMPSTLSELAEAYTLIINAPFAEAREGLERVTNTTLYPTLQPYSTIKQYDHSDIVYDIICRIVAFIHVGIFIVCFGLALLIHEPLFIIIYLTCFYAWATWTIIRYPYGSLRQKTILVVLLPSMSGYFFYRLITAPVRGLTCTTVQYGAMMRI